MTTKALAENNAGRAVNRSDKVGIVLALIVLSFSVYIQFLAGFIGDKNWLLLATRMWVGGKTLYHDIFEVNPPLIIWIYSLPVRLSQMAQQIQDYQVLIFMGLMVVALSIGVCLRIIGYHPMFSGNKRKQVQLAILLAFIFIFWTNPIYFFDREFIFLVLILPYMLALLPSLRESDLPPVLRIMIAVMAGIGFCIKPHCVIVFAGLQLIMLMRERTLRILFRLENIIIGLMAAAYLLSIWILYPDYFSIVLPMAAKTYSGFNQKITGGLGFIIVAVFTLAATFIDFRVRFSSPYRNDIYYLLCTCGFFLLYALANNGWGYTYNPLISMLYLINGWVMWDTAYLHRQYIENIKIAKRFMFVMRDCWINFAVNSVIVLIVYFTALAPRCSDYTECKLSESLMKVMQEQHAHAFGAIAISFHPWPSIVRMSDNRFSLETRFNHVWMLPKFFLQGPEFDRANEWITRYVADAYAEDLNMHRPQLMFVDSSPEFYNTGKHIDLVAYLSQYENFQHAWQSYHYIESVDYCRDKHAVAEDRKKKPDQKMICRYDVFERAGK